MPVGSTFPACCGINIVAGFPYDDENDYVEKELATLETDIEKAEGTYCNCHLIALVPSQASAAAHIEKLGYVPVGQFDSADGPYRVTLYARGLSLFEAAKAAPAKKAKPKTPKRSKRLRGIQLRRKK